MIIQISSHVRHPLPRLVINSAGLLTLAKEKSWIRFSDYSEVKVKISASIYHRSIKESTDTALIDYHNIARDYPLTVTYNYN